MFTVDNLLKYRKENREKLNVIFILQDYALYVKFLQIGTL